MRRGRDARPARGHPARREHRARTHGRAGARWSCAASPCPPAPAGSATRSRRGAERAGRRRGATPVRRPVPAHARQRRVPRRALRPGAGLPGGGQPAHRTGGDHRRGRASRSSRFTLDLSTFRVPRVRVDGRPAGSPTRGGKLHVTPSRPVAGPLHRRGALPRQPRTGAQPVGRPRLGGARRRRARREPADRRALLVPVQRPPRGQGDVPDRGHHRGALHRGRQRRARPRGAGRQAPRTWVFERPEPMATYLVSVQIGRYDEIGTRHGPAWRCSRPGCAGTPCATSAGRPR